MLTLSELSELVGQGEIETVLAVFPDLYGRLLGKRFEASFFLESVAESGTHGCDYLLTVDMEMEPVPGYQFANWDKGYGDVHLGPDMSSLRLASWLEKSAMVICDVQDEDHSLLSLAPRSLLQKQLAVADDLQLEAMAGSEIEYYIFRGDYREAHQAKYADLEPIGYYLEDYHTLQSRRSEGLHAAARRHLTQSGVPVECTKGEWGLGQHELNVRYSDALGMADRHATYKHCLKDLADSMGLSVTFMAKYAADRAGSSCHIHLSLWRDGKNAFDGDHATEPIRCTNLFRWFLAGWIQYVGDVMPFYAPNVNSYKRYQADSWAPTSLAWSLDNRTAGFRVVGSGSSLRIECRIPGADCNPYLAYAAALASGLEGIQQQLDPPEIFSGNAYYTDHPRVPKSLAEATDRFAESEFTRRVFGDEVVDHYAHFFRTEQDAYNSAVTDWERQRYFERI